MSKYDNLDPRTELEQTITADLKRALEKRGFNVRHVGGANNPDIEVWDDRIHINVEATQRTKSQQDGEYQSIKAHLKDSKKEYSNKKCFVWFVSPETYYRTINSITDNNRINKDELDLKILPIRFSTFEFFATKLIESSKEQYTKKDILTLFEKSTKYIDDESILRNFYEKLFYTDSELKHEVESREDERHQRVVEELVSSFKELENKLRVDKIAKETTAMKNVIYLVFIKLYEEKKSAEEDKKNRFTLAGFSEYQANVNDNKKAIHKLFENIKSDKEITGCGLLTDDDKLEPKLSDKFVIEEFIKKFEGYHFYVTKIDGLGAAYEVLGQSADKDRKRGQFFTPEHVVRFMVKLAELHPSDIVYDPACGTARFLTYSMEDMIIKTEGMRDKDKLIKKISEEQLVGTDDDPTVAKLAKMNMYIHGDGKTNIKDRDGLTFFEMDNKADVILTNPPLGDQSYLLPEYDKNFRVERMNVIPRRNLTQEKINKQKERLEQLQEALNNAKGKFKEAKRISRMIKNCKQKITEYESELHSDPNIITMGKQMKGGALFLNVAKYYLKDVRDSNEKPEWRGGKLLIILDEGILNTDTYEEVRDFIRQNFFVKAIISLTRDTFIPVAKTSTKTSILYAIKKDDPDVKQQEPIFFAHAEKVGIDTRKKVCANHLFNSGNDILSKYIDFKVKVLESYEGFKFNKEKFIKKRFTSGRIK